MNNIKEHIKKLEERLINSNVRKNPDLLNQILSENFEEIGSIGKISSRKEVIDWLITKEEGAQWSLNEFRIRKLTPELILAIYRANKKDQANNNYKGSMRSSIWKKHDDKWKMIFHQGTKILSENNI